MGSQRVGHDLVTQEQQQRMNLWSPGEKGGGGRVGGLWLAHTHAMFQTGRGAGRGDI